MAEGGGLLNRYTVDIRIVGSNPIPSATTLIISIGYRRSLERSIKQTRKPKPASAAPATPAELSQKKPRRSGARLGLLRLCQRATGPTYSPRDQAQPTSCACQIRSLRSATGSLAGVGALAHRSNSRMASAGMRIGGSCPAPVPEMPERARPAQVPHGCLRARYEKSAAGASAPSHSAGALRRVAASVVHLLMAFARKPASTGSAPSPGKRRDFRTTPRPSAIDTSKDRFRTGSFLAGWTMR